MSKLSMRSIINTAICFAVDSLKYELTGETPGHEKYNEIVSTISNIESLTGKISIKQFNEDEIKYFFKALLIAEEHFETAADAVGVETEHGAWQHSTFIQLRKFRWKKIGKTTIEAMTEDATPVPISEIKSWNVV